MPAVIDMTGRAIGRLTVVGPADRPPGVTKGGRWWWCRCECGGELAVAANNLRKTELGHDGGTASCGCLAADSARGVVESARAARTGVRVGDRYGRLVVTGEVARRRANRKWSCRCDCGRERAVWGHALRHGDVTDCGGICPLRRTDA